MGRRVYWQAVIIVAISLLQGTPSHKSVAQLQRLFDVDRKTVMRWRVYFLEIFPQSPQWQRIRGLFPSSLSNENLPADLLNHFILYNKNTHDALAECLRILACGLPP
ncbi:MAG: hypothetical protein OEM02_15260 [Desulfobulbaceae bacterium]|nr:hypothetical protein [Desulfobulbaceae bacterium]